MNKLTMRYMCLDWKQGPVDDTSAPDEFFLDYNYGGDCFNYFITNRELPEELAEFLITNDYLLSSGYYEFDMDKLVEANRVYLEGTGEENKAFDWEGIVIK